MGLTPGDIVFSIAGRDSGGYFVVVDADDSFAMICDGKSRKTDKPKRKKIKHLKTDCGRSEFIAEKLSRGETVTNRELKRELNRIQSINL